MNQILDKKSFSQKNLKNLNMNKLMLNNEKIILRMNHCYGHYKR